MLIWLPILLLCVLTLTIGAAQAGDATPAEKYEGWIVEQLVQYDSHGIAMISDHGCRYQLNNGGTSLVSEAPDWKLYLINDKKKLYFFCPPASGTNKMAGRIAVMNMFVKGQDQNTVWEPVKSPKRPAKMCGHPVAVWHLYPKSRAKDAQSLGEFRAAADIKVAPSVIGYVNNVHGWPKTNLLTMYCASANSKKPYAQTISIKRGFVSADLFRVPPTYRKASNELEVIMDMGGVDDLLDVMGEPKTKVQPHKP